MENISQHIISRVAIMLLMLLALNMLCVPGNLGMAVILSGAEVLSFIALLVFFPRVPELGAYSDMIRDFGFAQKDLGWLTFAGFIAIFLGFSLL